MKKIYRHLFFQCTALFVTVTLVLTFTMWLTQSIRFIEYIMSRGLGLGTFLKLSSYLIPGLMAPIIPVSLLISVIFVLNRLHGDRELIVLRSIGLSNLQIKAPIMVLATICFGFTIFLNMQVLPAAKRAFKDQREEIRSNLTGQWIQPGEFINLSDLTFYAREKSRSGAMRGVLIYDARNKKKPITITAEYGEIHETPQGLSFIIYNGSHQTLGEKDKKPYILSFDSYTVKVPNPKSQERPLRLNELSFSQLQAPDQDISQQERKQRHYELHERLIFPLLIFPFILLAGIIFLSGDFNRRGHARRILFAVISCLVLKILTFVALNVGKKFFNVSIVYALILSLTSLLAFKLFSYKTGYLKLSNKKDETAS